MPVFGTILSNATVVFSQWTTAGSDIYYTGGNVGIGITLPTATAHFKGSGATNATYGLKVENSASVLNFFVDDSGAVSATQGYWIDGIKSFHYGFSGTGGTSTFIGVSAGLTETALGNGNLGINRGALASITDGIRNVALGYNCLSSLTVNGNNVAIGWEALRNFTGTESIAIGSSAAPNATNGSRNTIIGQQSANVLTTGIRNVIIGAYAEVDNAARSQCVILGDGAAPTADNQLIIGSASAAIANAYIGTSVAQPDANLFIGSLQTVQGGLTTGAGIAVRLGRYFAGAVAADGNFIEMEINGVVYKLATAV